MKKTKILVPALSILALGMAASVTGTVAWFTSATAVKASTLTVAVASNQDLRIHNDYNAAADATGWGQSIDFSKQDLALVPATPIKGEASATEAHYETKARPTSKVYQNVTYETVGFIAANKDTVDARTGAGVTIKAGASDNDNSASYTDVTETQHGFMHEDYALKYEGYVGTGDSAQYTVQVNTTITIAVGTDQKIDKCLRVGILDVTASELTIYSLPDADGNSYTIEAAEVTLTSISDEDGAPKGYHVFVWYEGEDANCINANAYSNTLSLVIDHAIVD